LEIIELKHSASEYEAGLRLIEGEFILYRGNNKYVGRFLGVTGYMSLAFEGADMVHFKDMEGVYGNIAV